jgi:hypothetical protein
MSPRSEEFMEHAREEEAERYVAATGRETSSPQASR